MPSTSRARIISGVTVRATRRRVPDDDVLALAVVLVGDLLRRAEDRVDRLADPLPRAAADQLAADDQHQQRRNDGEPEERADQLRAEPRERQAAAPFDHQLDDVARQHEAEREEHRQIRDRQRVEQDLGEEVRVEIGRAVGERDHRHQRREQDDDAEEDQPRVVAERPPGGRGRAAALRRGQRRRLESRSVVAIGHRRKGWSVSVAKPLAFLAILAVLATRGAPEAPCSSQEGEFRQPGHVGALPGPDERRVARRGAGPDADVILGVRLEPCVGEEVEPIEAGQPFTRQALAIERPRILGAAVGVERDVIAARQVVVANAGADRGRLNGAMQPGRGASPAARRRRRR